MGNLGEALAGEVGCAAFLSIGNVGIAETVAVTWGVTGVVLFLSFLLTRRLRAEKPGWGQLMLECAVTGLQRVGRKVAGEKGDRYATALVSVLLCLGIAALAGVLGFEPPTKNPDAAESAAVGNLGEALVEEMNCETVFSIGGIGIAESVVVTWIIMGAVVLISLLLTRGLKVENPGRRQQMLECAVTGLQDIGKSIVGEEGGRYVPYLTSILLYLGIANLAGIMGFKPPTKDLNVTAALAVMSILLIEGAGLRAKGFRGWLKAFVEPVPIVTPINVLEILIKPLSLCMRLFGNVLGAFVVMKLIEHILPVGLPVVFGIYFDLFDGLIQAYVFVFLTGLFLREAVE